MPTPLDFLSRVARERRLGDAGRRMEELSRRPGARSLPEISELPIKRRMIPQQIERETGLDIPPHIEYRYRNSEAPLEVFLVGEDAGDYQSRYPQSAAAYGALPVLRKPGNEGKRIFNISSGDLQGEGMGTPLYLRAWDDIEKASGRNVPHNLSHMNATRRSSNMLARSLRGGDPDTVILSPEQQLSPISGGVPWMQPEEFHNLPREVQMGLLAEAERRNNNVDINAFNTAYGTRHEAPGLGSQPEDFSYIADLMHTAPGRTRSRYSPVGYGSLRRSALFDELLQNPRAEPPEQFLRGMFKRRGGLVGLNA